MLNRWKAVAAVVAAGVLGYGNVAQAQNVTYSTSGVFSGALAGYCDNTAPSPSCEGGGFKLVFEPVALSQNNIPNMGGYVPLGNFFLSGEGPMVTVPPGQLLFTIVINQSAPSSGTGNISGSISGTIQGDDDGNLSTLLFAPNQTVTIGDVTYTVKFDSGENGIRLAYTGDDDENSTSVKAQLTSVVPEPASMMLIGTGLVGVFGAARRRKAAQLGV